MRGKAIRGLCVSRQPHEGTKDVGMITLVKSCLNFSNREGQLVTLTEAGGSVEGKPGQFGFKMGQEWWRKEFQAANVDSCLEDKRS